MAPGLQNLGMCQWLYVFGVLKSYVIAGESFRPRRELYFIGRDLCYVFWWPACMVSLFSLCSHIAHYIEDDPQRLWFVAGIVDILQQYNFKKQMESTLKGIRYAN